MKKIIENKDSFTAKETNFQGTSGYMVCQFHNGKKVVEQFVSKEVYKEFCELCGIKPKLVK